MARPRKTENDPAPEIRDVGPLKPCPKCGGKASGGGLDIHGNYRCFCVDCGFWDAMVYESDEEAEKGWQLAGGPNREGW